MGSLRQGSQNSVEASRRLLRVSSASHGAWEIAASGVEGSAYSIIAGLMGDVSTQASQTLRMRSLRPSA